MQNSRKGLFVAVGMIAGGTLAFFVFLEFMGIDLDQRPLGLFGWMVGGVLIGPGFGYLIKWKRMQNNLRDARTRQD